MNAVKARAEEVLSLVERDEAVFGALPDEPGQQVHRLFAGLYRETTARWLQALEDAESPLFTYLVVRRFYNIYQSSVPDHLASGQPHAPVPWRRYHWLAKRLTMRSPITSHLLLISLGARAHVYHDLSEAICLAAQDYRGIVGNGADFQPERVNIIGPVSAKAFFEAALDYVAWHRSRQSGWRRMVLSAYGSGLRVLRPLWLGIFEGWRRHAWNTAFNASRTPAAHHNQHSILRQ